MSTATVTSAQTLINQGFSQGLSQGFTSTNPSGIRLNRRGRLARTFVVLSLAVVLGSVVSAKAGAGTDAPAPKAHTFITVTVAPGETLWALANRVADGGDVRGLVAEIVSVNSLPSADVLAGQKLRIPLQ